ncbi:hypothetical protein ACJX0J_011710, partial [Zea mays]
VITEELGMNLETVEPHMLGSCKKVITEELGMNLENVEPHMLGSCKKLILFQPHVLKRNPFNDHLLLTNVDEEGHLYGVSGGSGGYAETIFLVCILFLCIIKNDLSHQFIMIQVITEELGMNLENVEIFLLIWIAKILHDTGNISLHRNIVLTRNKKYLYILSICHLNDC